MRLPPVRSISALKHRVILKIEVIEDRVLPGDALWSLSCSPLESLLEIAADAGGVPASTAEPGSEQQFLTAGDIGDAADDPSSAVWDSIFHAVENEAPAQPATSQSDQAQWELPAVSPLGDWMLTDGRESVEPPMPVMSGQGGLFEGQDGPFSRMGTFAGINVDTPAPAPISASGSPATGGFSFADASNSALLGAFIEAPDQGAVAHPMSGSFSPQAGTGPTGYSPAQIRHAYGLDALSYTGAGQTIAIVDAFNAPNIVSDANVFSRQFSLPEFNVGSGPKLTVVGQNGGSNLPRTDAGWALETSLDVEWAHAIAPQANIVLVESTTASFGNMFAAVNYAAGQGHTVSMSWGASEFSGETSYDSYFNRSGVVFTAASGDNGTGVIYPAASKYVLAVGGTTLQLDSSSNRLSETAWSGSGGGVSKYETEPGYQTTANINFTSGKRGVPDVAWNANPSTGFAVYDSTNYQGKSGWWTVGGTSAGAPQWAALISLTDQGRLAAGKSYLSGNNLNYSAAYAAAGASYLADYYDITVGSNGTGAYTSATAGYDTVTGLGAPRANNLVTYLINN